MAHAFAKNPGLAKVIFDVYTRPGTVRGPLTYDCQFFSDCFNDFDKDAIRAAAKEQIPGFTRLPHFRFMLSEFLTAITGRRVGFDHVDMYCINTGKTILPEATNGKYTLEQLVEVLGGMK